MNSRHALNAYRQTGAQGGVTDASPHQLITMLFNGALDRIASARGAMERGETAKEGEMIGKAISIVDNLRASLDHQQGGELAQRLSDLYEYMERRLLEARRESDPSKLQEVAGLLREIQSGWEEIPAEHKA